MKKKKNGYIKILQWNCRSILKNIDYLKQYLSSKNIQVLLLQSLNVSSDNLPIIPGYYHPPVFEQCLGRAQTAIYIREGLDFCIRTPPVSNNVISVSCCAVMVKFSANLILNLASVYLPKGPDNENTEWLKEFQDQRDKWIIGGDFNAHAPFWDNACSFVSSNRFIDNVADSVLCILNNGNITRVPDVANHNPSAIDLTFASPSLALNCSWETGDDSLGSDHVPIIISLNNRIEEKEFFEEDIIPKYNYKRADWSLFKDSLKQLNIAFSSLDDIDDLYKRFRVDILEAANISIPKIKGTHSKKHSGNVWWNTECETANVKKKENFKLYCQKRSASNHKKMKDSAKNSNEVIENAKIEHWNNFCNSEIRASKDMGKIWEEIKAMKNGFTSPQYPIKLNNNDIPSATEKVEAFVNIFANVSCPEGLTEDDRNYRIQEENCKVNTDGMQDNSNVINAPITVLEIKEAIRQIPIKKSSVGVDAISNQMLRNLPENCIFFMHLSINVGEMVNCQKYGSIQLLFQFTNKANLLMI